jgi:hypothetical protein
MAAASRDFRMSRRSWLVAGMACPVSRAAAFLADATPVLGVTWDGDNLHVAAPNLHFLTGQPLNRLKNGASVVFLSQLTLFLNGHTTEFRRVADRLVLSYDLWEEKFSVTRLGVPRASRSHLTAQQAEAWCLDSLFMPALGLAPDRLFHLRFDLRTADARELKSVVGEPGISITGLIEIFSRKPGPEEPHWSLEAGPLRLSDLVRTPGRGQRSG